MEIIPILIDANCHTIAVNCKYFIKRSFLVIGSQRFYDWTFEISEFNGMASFRIEI